MNEYKLYQRISSNTSIEVKNEIQDFREAVGILRSICYKEDYLISLQRLNLDLVTYFRAPASLMQDVSQQIMDCIDKFFQNFDTMYRDIDSMQNLQHEIPKINHIFKWHKREMKGILLGFERELIATNNFNIEKGKILQDIFKKKLGTWFKHFELAEESNVRPTELVEKSNAHPNPHHFSCSTSHSNLTSVFLECLHEGAKFCLWPYKIFNSLILFVAKKILFKISNFTYRSFE